MHKLLFAAVMALCVLGCIVPALAAAPKAPKVARVPRTELSHPCSRAISRNVRSRFQMAVQKMRLNSEKRTEIKWPEGCPFHPQVDLWARHEKSKSRESKDKYSKLPGWLCNFSGKVFKSEHYVDLHLERVYMNETPGDVGDCVADYCEIFEVCKVAQASFIDSLSSEPPSCDTEKLSISNQQCDTIMEKCFPLMAGETQELDVKLRNMFCQPLTCESRAERHFSERRNSAFWVVFGIVIIGLIIFCQMSGKSEDPRRSRRYSEFKNSKKYK